MKDLAAFLLIVGVLLLVAVSVIRWAFPSEPALVIDASPAFASADPQAPMLFAPCPLAPGNLPPRKPQIERT